MKKVDGYTLNDTTLMVMVDGTAYTVPRDSKVWKKCVDAVRAGNGDVIVKLLTAPTTLPKEISDNEVTIEDGVVKFMGRPVFSKLAERILDIAHNDLDPKPYSRFLSNLQRNPNQNSVEQLYGFLEKYSFAITDDGHFLAYKVVNSDLTDKYTGTTQHSVGSKVSMPRQAVSTNPNDTCSPGLHVGAWEYAGIGGWYHNDGDRVLLVKVNPADVCRVPNDHDMKKIAVCEYEVVKEIMEPVNELAEQTPRPETTQWEEWKLAICDGKWLDADAFEDEEWNREEIKLFYKKEEVLNLYYGDSVEVLDDGDVLLETEDGTKRFKLHKIHAMMVRVGYDV